MSNSPRPTKFNSFGEPIYQDPNADPGQNETPRVGGTDFKKFK